MNASTSSAVDIDDVLPSQVTKADVPEAMLRAIDEDRYLAIQQAAKLAEAAQWYTIDVCLDKDLTFVAGEPLHFTPVKVRALQHRWM